MKGYVTESQLFLLRSSNVVFFDILTSKIIVSESKRKQTETMLYLYHEQESIFIHHQKLPRYFIKHIAYKLVMELFRIRVTKI